MEKGQPEILEELSKQGVDLQPFQIFKTMMAGNRQLNQKFPEKV